MNITFSPDEHQVCDEGQPDANQEIRQFQF
jgi:hypothetical protein